MRSGWNKLKVKRTQGGLVWHLLRAHIALRSRSMQPRVTLYQVTAALVSQTLPARTQEENKVIESTQFRKVSLATSENLSHQASPVVRIAASLCRNRKFYVSFVRVSAHDSANQDTTSLLPTRLRCMVTTWRATVASLVLTRRRRILLASTTILVSMRRSTTILVVLMLIIVARTAIGTAWCTISRASVASYTRYQFCASFPSRVFGPYLVVHSHLVDPHVVVLARNLVLAHRILIDRRNQLASHSHVAGHRAVAGECVVVSRRSRRGVDPGHIVVRDSEHRCRIGRLERCGCRKLVVRCRCRFRLKRHQSSRSRQRRCLACCARCCQRISSSRMT